MTEFEKLLQEQKNNMDAMKEKYLITDNFIRRIQDQYYRNPTEEECAAYYERLIKRMERKNASNSSM